MASSIFSRTLQKAAELAGGRDALCKELRISASNLEKWIADQAPPPRSVFLRAVDFILDETAPPGSADAADPPAPRDCSSIGDASSYFD